MLFVAIEGITASESVDLFEGVTLQPTYSHIFAPTMLASRPPPPEGGPHGAPWFACEGGHRAYDIHAELRFDTATLAQHQGTNLLWITAATLRLIVRSPVRFAAVCDESFSQLPSASERRPKITIKELQGAFRPRAPIEVSSYVSTWRELIPLVMAATAGERYGRALRYLDSAWFATSPAAASIATWTALEALLLEPFTQGIKKELAKRIADTVAKGEADRESVRASVRKLYEV